MSSLIEFYNLTEWYNETFSDNEKNYIDIVIPFMNKEVSVNFRPIRLF